MNQTRSESGEDFEYTILEVDDGFVTRRNGVHITFTEELPADIDITSYLKALLDEGWIQILPVSDGQDKKDVVLLCGFLYLRKRREENEPVLK